MAEDADHKLLETLIVRELEKRGGGGDNGGMEPRIAKLEAMAESSGKRLDRVELDLRMILGAIVLVLGMIVTGYVQLSNRIGGLEISAAKSDAKLDAIMSRLPTPNP